MSTTALFLVSYIALVAFAAVVLGYVAPRDYLTRGQLSPRSTVLQVLVFFAYGGFPSIYLPRNWPAVSVTPFIHLIGVTLIVVGLGFILYGMFRLGVVRSLGRGTAHLERSGIYHRSRNPQSVACGLYVIGFFLLWPSWYAAGWALLFPAMIQVMVTAEEEHLRRTHGQRFEEYRQEVPRYLGLRSFRISHR